jgi:hypothetical protein
MNNETLASRVSKRIQESQLGDLITEDDLKELVKQSINDIFFKERGIESNYGRTTLKPSLFHEVVEKLMRETFDRLVGEWIRDNPQVMADYWKKVCDKGLSEYVQSVQSHAATSQIRDFLGTWVEETNRQRANNGLPPVYL